MIFIILLALMRPATVANKNNNANPSVEQTAVRQERIESPLLKASKEYILGAGDVIEISVERIDEISGTYTISAEGEIHFPTLLPSIKANGQTARQLQALLTGQLLEYMYEPKVKVVIKE